MRKTQTQADTSTFREFPKHRNEPTLQFALNVTFAQLRKCATIIAPLSPFENSQNTEMTAGHDTFMLSLLRKYENVRAAIRDAS